MQILDALAVLRDARVIHCDLKPENVLVKSCESGTLEWAAQAGVGGREGGRGNMQRRAAG